MPINKILLLGPGDSGKTTLLKQMKILHSDGFKESERMEMKARILENIVKCTKKLVQTCPVLNLTIQPESEPQVKIITTLLADPRPSTTSTHLTSTSGLSNDVVDAIKFLWNDEAISECYKRRNETQLDLQDTASYFLERLDHFLEQTYIPTDQDILMARSETTKPTETEFIINGVTHLVIDVGGQKTYRPTWAVFFDDSKAVIFVVSLASYDQIMAEDSGMNRMHDSMRLFETICNNPLLRSVAMILLLNKVDLFEAKIPRSSVRKHFADLNKSKDEKDSELVKQFFKKKFEKLNKNVAKDIYVHYTTNTDTNLMRAIISMIMDIIVKVGLGSAGLF